MKYVENGPTSPYARDQGIGNEWPSAERTKMSLWRHEDLGAKLVHCDFTGYLTIYRTGRMRLLNVKKNCPTSCSEYRFYLSVTPRADTVYPAYKPAHPVSWEV